MLGMDRLTSNSVNSSDLTVLKNYQEHLEFLNDFKFKADLFLFSITLVANFRMPFFFAIQFYWMESSKRLILIMMVRSTSMSIYYA